MPAGSQRADHEVEGAGQFLAMVVPVDWSEPRSLTLAHSAPTICFPT